MNGEPAAIAESARERMRAARVLVEDVAHNDGHHTYGVNTGFGRFVTTEIPEELTAELQLRLLRSHACGVGEPYPRRARPGGAAPSCEHAREGLLGSARGDGGATRGVSQSRDPASRSEPWIGRGERRPRATRAPSTPARRRGRGGGRRRAHVGCGRTRTRRLGADPARVEGGPVADQRHAVHGLLRCARRRPFQAARPGGRHGLRALARGAAGFSRRVRAGGAGAPPSRGPGCGRRQRSPPRRGLGDHGRAPLVRQGAGRVLAALCAAGARGGPRPACLRRGNRRRRAQRRHRQPARARRRRRARLERELSRPAGRVRARRARDGGVGAREHL